MKRTEMGNLIVSSSIGIFLTSFLPLESISINSTGSVPNKHYYSIRIL